MVNDKTFIISSKIEKLDPTWKSFSLKNGRVFNYQEKLQVTTNENNSVVLIGHAWSVEEGKPSPAESVARMKGDESDMTVFEIEKYWCGRYILIVGETLYLDTVGTMGCFYGNGKISNSVNVIRLTSGVIGGGKIS